MGSPIQLLQRINLFNGLTNSELKLILEHCTSARRFAAEQIIFREGAPGNELYCLPEGQVRVELDVGGRVAARTVTIVSGPDVFGEVAFLDGSPRSATTIAQQGLTLYVIEREGMVALMNEIPSLGYGIMGNLARILAGKVRRGNQLLIDELRKLHDIQASAIPLAARKYSDVFHGYTTQVWV
ncbi:MAG: cyclic nucleotide-binding domain-containing protein [Magnetococcales bacterium]|nr:cyclic nucleotide-binding domain-containing protein [Magnetococcales bacterium]